MTAPGQTWSSRPYLDHVSAGLSSRVDAFDDARQRTQQPIVTGTSVLGIKFAGGVMLASDTLASYGSLARFMDVRRLAKVEDSNAVIGASGDMADFQYLLHEIEKLGLRESTAGDGHALTPPQLYAYLTRVMYARRSKVDPLWNSLIVAGVDKRTAKPFLGYVDLLGTTYESPTIATGFGMHLAQPLLRKAVEEKQIKGEEISEAEAKEILESCMKVLFYRDARSLNRFQIATVTQAGSQISEPRSIDTEWAFADKLRGYGPQTQ